MNGKVFFPQGHGIKFGRAAISIGYIHGCPSAELSVYASRVEFTRRMRERVTRRKRARQLRGAASWMDSVIHTSCPDFY